MLSASLNWKRIAVVGFIILGWGLPLHSANAAPPAAYTAAQDAYPLTITAQSAIKLAGGPVPYVITVTNHSTTLRIAPLVYLDPVAAVASSTQPLYNTFNVLYQQETKTWAVGTLQPGQIKVLVVWYNPTVTFPAYTDPTTGTVYPGATPQLGGGGAGYSPNFTLYDNYFKLYTPAGIPVPAGFDGGK